MTQLALFRPGSPFRITVGVLTLLGAIAAVYVADVLRFVDCASEASSECSAAGHHQQVAAYVGLVPAICTLVSSLRTRGHPRFWLIVTALVYGVWIVLARRWVDGGEPG